SPACSSAASPSGGPPSSWARPTRTPPSAAGGRGPRTCRGALSPSSASPSPCPRARLSRRSPPAGTPPPPRGAPPPRPRSGPPLPRLARPVGLGPPAVPGRAEVGVVGGGCRGTSTAFHLARRGVDAVLLECGHVASGATGHSGAIVRRQYEARVGVRLARDS